jgi:Tfp pilus assembly protein PilF
MFLFLASVCFCLAFSSSVAAQERNAQRRPGQEATEPQESKKSTAPANQGALDEALKKGEWTTADTIANDLVRQDPKSPIGAFVVDVARNILLHGRGRALSPYDFPYADDGAKANLRSWVQGLLSADQSNENFWILDMVLKLKGFADNDGAIRDLETALKLAPNNTFILSALGGLYGGKGRINEAEGLLEKVLALDPKHSTAYMNLGMVAMSRRDLTKAESMFKKSVTLPGAGPMEWFNLGSLYYYQKRMADARSALEKAIALSPKLIEARYNLAGVYYHLGQSAKSKEQLRHVVEIAPNSAIGRKAKQNLSQLGQ